MKTSTRIEPLPQLACGRSLTICKGKDAEISSLREQLSTLAREQLTMMARESNANESIRELKAEIARLRAALEEIATLVPRPFGGFPADWHEQIDACKECQGWAKNHPIQQGICDEHRKPLWDRERYQTNEVIALGSRAATIAREALKAQP